MHGLVRSLVNNMVVGVTDGFTKQLEIIGVGYRAEIADNKLNLIVGLSHPVAFGLPPGIQAKTEKAKSSPDQAKIDQLNADIASAQKAGEDLFEATDWAVQEWDLAMKSAVQAARLVECKKTGGTDCEIGRAHV